MKRTDDGYKSDDPRDPVSDLNVAERGKQMVRKKTGRWCKGRKGIEHDWHIEKPANHPNGACRELTRMASLPEWSWMCYHSEVCQRCGKQRYLDPSRCPERSVGAAPVEPLERVDG